jgi:toxin ParE1/3/4
MNVHWTEPALDDLRAIEGYIGRHSIQYARGMIERIFSRSAQLGYQPNFGAVVPGYEHKSLREVLAEPYRIIYRVFDDQVDVVAVVHAARRLPQDL